MKGDQLLEALRQEDQAALEDMIARYHRYVSAIIGKMLVSVGSPQDVEELVQDTFYGVWRNAGNIQGNLKAYLCTAARNQAKSYLRRSRPATVSTDTVDIPDRLGDLEDAAIQRETARLLRQAIDRMRPRDREIFLRTYYYLQNSQEIAREMGISPNTVRSCLLRGRKVLQKTLGKEGLL